MEGNIRALQKIWIAAKLRLLLDYDGTLAEFAATPDEIYPDADLIGLLETLQKNPRFHVAVISGRRLSHIQALIPVDGILMAGTYGIEIFEPDGKQINRVDFGKVRPYLDRIKPLWSDLISQGSGFYLEDKGWSLALHAKFADQSTAADSLQRARQLIDQQEIPLDVFRILGGHKFLELAPRLANKGSTVEYLFSRYPLEGALPVYIGDDDKDEEAFEVILKNQGVSIKVGANPVATHAQLRLDSPRSVRRFLSSLV